MLNLRRSYTGRCWIVGNGPSLAYTPLEKLRPYYCFGMNKIALLFDRTSWRPDFLVSTTTDLLSDDYRRVVETGIATAWYAFLDAGSLPKNYQLPPQTYRLNCTETEALLPDDARNDFWSDDVETSISKYGSTILPAFQLAVWMGFTTIYLAGCDLGYRPFGDGGDPNHFVTDYYPTGAILQHENDAMIRAHEIAAWNCKRRGVQVWNATIGGQLEVHPRIDFDQVRK